MSWCMGTLNTENVSGYNDLYCHQQCGRDTIDLHQHFLPTEYYKMVSHIVIFNISLYVY